MTPERMRVLELLEQGKITAADAAELLRALGDGNDHADGEDALPAQGRRQRNGRNDRERSDQPRWFRVRVTETATGRTKANVSIPYSMVNFGLRFAPGSGFFGSRRAPRQVDDLLDALRTGKRGTIYDVTDHTEGQRIEIIVE